MKTKTVCSVYMLKEYDKYNRCIESFKCEQRRGERLTDKEKKEDKGFTIHIKITGRMI